MINEMYLWFLLAGTVAGVCAGLFGVGGGLIIVPALVWIFTAYGMPLDVVAHVAVGTALATIILTSISSMSAHHKRGGVRWDIFKNMAKGLVLGSLVGAYVATLINGNALQAIIGVGACLMAVKMLFFPNKEDLNKPLPKDYAQMGAGVVIGGMSAIFGIGGGSLTVPYLNHYGVVMQKAVGTSAACGLPIAIAGALGFMFFGMAEQVNVPNSIGYVHIYAFLGISVMSFFTAKLGAKAAHALSPAMLKKCFAIMLCIVGCFFIFKGLG